MNNQKRCWGNTLPQFVLDYHDTVWGKPCHDDKTLFKMLCMEAFQAGLSWNIVLRREAQLEAAFDGFDPTVVAAYPDGKADELMLFDGMIKNRKKIEAVLHNAKCYLKIQKEFGSFDNYIWGFTGGKVTDNHFTESSQLPASTPLSDKIAKDLKKRGFKFLGTVTVYAFMQSMGLVNDHLVDCEYR